MMSAAVSCSAFVRRRAGARSRSRMMFAIGLATAAAYGQSAPQPRFEVASVKPAGSIFSRKPERSGGRFRWTTQLCYLVGYAHRLDYPRVSGRNICSTYSVEATFDPAATDDQVRSEIQGYVSALLPCWTRSPSGLPSRVRAEHRLCLCCRGDIRPGGH